ncbi:MAG: sensor histidine kinase [Hyphomicrobiales bacterium]
MGLKLTWERPGQDEDQFRRYLIRALVRSGVCVIAQDRFDRYLFVANLPECWRVADGSEPTDFSIFGDELGARIAELKSEVRTTKEQRRVEIQVGERHFELLVETVPASIEAADVMITIMDLTEERRREIVLRVLLREVSHRSKNLLAIIQSIASQTAKHSSTLDLFLQKFRGRLFSLSRSQDLITDSSWSGARFGDLVREQTDRYLAEHPDRIRRTGDDPLLSPNAAIHVGLALHELVVNAISYGSHGRSVEPIVLTCAVERRGIEKEMVEITWSERRDEPGAFRHDNREDTRHFGSIVLERIVPASVNGTAEYEVTDVSISYRLKFPLAEAN